MGFSIDYGGGVLYAVVLTLLISVGIIVAFTLFAASKRARDDVVEQEGDDPDLIA